MATTPRTAPSKPRPTASKAAPKPVMFDIAQVEQEFNDSERPAPFTIRLKSGKVVTFADPMQLDWQVAASLDKRYPNVILQTLVPEEDLEDVYAETMPVAVVRRLFTSWQDHYQQDIDLGE